MPKNPFTNRPIVPLSTAACNQQAAFLFHEIFRDGGVIRIYDHGIATKKSFALQAGFFPTRRKKRPGFCLGR
jgi:hypothetical protein